MILSFHHFTEEKRKRFVLETQVQGEEDRRRNPKRKMDEVRQYSSNTQPILPSFSKIL